MKYCNNCKAELAEGAEFCTHCGQKVSDGDIGKPVNPIPFKDFDSDRLPEVLKRFTVYKLAKSVLPFVIVAVILIFVPLFSKPIRIGFTILAAAAVLRAITKYNKTTVLNDCGYTKEQITDILSGKRYKLSSFWLKPRKALKMNAKFNYKKIATGAVIFIAVISVIKITFGSGGYSFFGDSKLTGESTAATKSGLNVNLNGKQPLNFPDNFSCVDYYQDNDSPDKGLWRYSAHYFKGNRMAVKGGSPDESELADRNMYAYTIFNEGDYNNSRKLISEGKVTASTIDDIYSKSQYVSWVIRDFVEEILPSEKLVGTETVNGYECQKYLLKFDNGEYTVVWYYMTDDFTVDVKHMFCNADGSIKSQCSTIWGFGTVTGTADVTSPRGYYIIYNADGVATMPY